MLWVLQQFGFERKVHGFAQTKLNFKGEFENEVCKMKLQNERKISKSKLHYQRISIAKF